MADMTLRFVTKAEYWEIEDSGVLSGLARPSVWHMKTVQDAIAFERLRKYQQKALGEVGGGDSRILKTLARSNRCYNFEVFQGRDGGPTQEVLIDGVRNVHALVGHTGSAFPGGTLDALFSISVVEHIPSSELEGFFSDSWRLLRPGGVAIHLVDVYVSDDAHHDPVLEERLSEYAKPLTGLFTPEGEILDPKNTAFSCRFASNPDNVMAAWNRQVPALSSRRASSQLVSLLWVGHRPTDPE